MMAAYRKYLFDSGGIFEKKTCEKVEDQLPVTDLVYKEVDLGDVYDNKPFKGLILGVNTVDHIKNYLNISFNYLGGELAGKIWGNGNLDLSAISEELLRDKTFSVDGEWNEWPKGSGNFSVVVRNYKHVEVDQSDLMPVINESRNALRDELIYYINTMSKDKAELTLKILEEVWDEFSTKPAARRNHHFQLGGLLQHTVENLRIADHLLDKDYDETEETLNYVERIFTKARQLDFKKHRENTPGGRFYSSFYDANNRDHLPLIFGNYLEKMFNCEEPLKRDVVIFSLIFHDVAKIVEYTHFGDTNERYKPFFPGLEFSAPNQSVGVSMDSNGSRLGHITIGMMFLHTKMIEHGLTDGDFYLDVLSCVSSHHGNLEWSSPTTPKTKEEYLVHICDYIDAKIASP